MRKLVVIPNNQLAKIQPLLDMFRELCLMINSEKIQCIDEQIIPFKGKHALKQYVKNKPKKWGFKVFSRNSSDGYMHDFFIYNGATEIEDGCGFAAGDVVVKLCQTLKVCFH